MFQLPSTVLLSDANDDDVSRSQHKLAMAKEMADNSIIANSTSDSEGEGENDPFYHLLYCMVFSSRLINFIAQNTMLYELAIQIPR